MLRRLPSICKVHKIIGADLNSVLVEGASEDKDKAVPRHSTRLSDVQLTPIVIAKLPRAIRPGPLKAKRRQLTDFERFKVMRLRKQVRFEEKKQLAKIKASG